MAGIIAKRWSLEAGEWALVYSEARLRGGLVVTASLAINEVDGGDSASSFSDEIDAGHSGSLYAEEVDGGSS